MKPITDIQDLVGKKVTSVYDDEDSRGILIVCDDVYARITTEEEYEGVYHHSVQKWETELALKVGILTQEQYDEKVAKQKERDHKSALNSYRYNLRRFAQQHKEEFVKMLNEIGTAGIPKETQS